jgi:hypothetical protein
MRWIAVLMFVAFEMGTPPGIIFGNDVIISARRVNISTAQQDAELMARSGVLRHCGTAGGRREGIGMSSAGPDAALKSCCYFGRYRIVEKGVAWSPVKRAWFAVIRYE